MSIKIRDIDCKKKLKPSWDDIEELKYLICAIDNCKSPSVPSLPSCSIILPPRIEEISCKVPPRRPPCVPPPRCCPITPGPCCPWLLPSSIPTQPSLPPNPYCDPCDPCSLLPCYSCE